MKRKPYFPRVDVKILLLCDNLGVREVFCSEQHGTSLECASDEILQLKEILDEIIINPNTLEKRKSFKITNMFILNRKNVNSLLQTHLAVEN